MISSILISVFISLIFSLLLAYGFRRRGPGPLNGLLFMFIIIFMFSWAIGSWLVPSARFNAWMPSWLVYLLIAFIIMLLLGSVIPPSPSGKRSQIISKSDVDKMVKEEKNISDAKIAVGIFFWILIFALFILAILKHLR